MSAPPKRALLPLAQAGILLAGLAAILLTFRDYGASWDESTNVRHGELLLVYFRSMFQDRSLDQFINMRFYGPVYDLFVAAVSRVAPSASLEIRHLLNALTGLLTLPALFVLGRLVERPAIGLWGSLALGTMPVFYGHGFVNSKDLPFACAFAWSMVVLIRMIIRGEMRWRDVIGCGLAFGVTAGIRPGGMILLVPLLVCAVALGRATGRPGFERGRSPVLLAGIVTIVCLAWCVMIAFWPAAHASPLLHPLRSMRIAAHFPNVYPLLFEGRIVNSNSLPWYYLLKSFAITTPPALLLLAAAGLLATARWIWTDPRRERSIAASLVLVWLVVPVAVWTLQRPNILDGTRHFLFVLPALALLAGAGAAWVVDMTRRASMRSAAGAAVTCLLVLPLRDLVRLHPYQMTYYNLFVGGLGGASGRYETDYWLTSYKEGMEWIQSRRRPADGGEIRVLVAANELSRLCAEHYVRDGAELSTMFNTNETGALPETADFYLATTRYGLDRNYPGSPIVRSLGRDGAVFAVIRERRPAGTGTGPAAPPGP